MNKLLILHRIKELYKFSSDAELANFLGIKPNRLSNWYARNSVDYDIIITKCEGVDLNWILTGTKEITTEVTIDHEKSNNDFAEYINHLEKDNKLDIEIINKLRAFALDFYKDAMTQKEALLEEKRKFEQYKEIIRKGLK